MVKCAEQSALEKAISAFANAREAASSASAIRLCRRMGVEPYEIFRLDGFCDGEDLCYMTDKGDFRLKETPDVYSDSHRERVAEMYAMDHPQAVVPTGQWEDPAEAERDREETSSKLTQWTCSRPGVFRPEIRRGVSWDEAVEKLAMYEETGCDPEDVEALQALLMGETRNTRETMYAQKIVQILKDRDIDLEEGVRHIEALLDAEFGERNDGCV